MMNRSYDVVIEKDCDGFYVATVPEIPGCHTQAKSLDELVRRTKEVIELCMDVVNDEIQPNQFIGIQRIAVPA
jgi:predicted RNase H-like HicB family nuclease